MYIDLINLNNIRVFESVYRSRSMTKAAEELHITQSGVSQHIKSLEDVLGIKLFDRIKQRLVPTSEADQLYLKWSHSLHSIEETLVQLKGGELQLSGTVKIGLPIEFGNNIVLPLLSEFAKSHEKVRYEIKYGFASEMNDLLLNGELDFAFLDNYVVDKQIVIDKIYDETLELCASEEYLKNFGQISEDKKYFEQLDYVDYLKDEPVLKMWFKHHFNFNNINFNIRAHLMDVQGIKSLIVSDLGAGILPRHHVKKIDSKRHPIHIFKGKGSPLKNTISIAKVHSKTQTQLVLELLRFLSKKLRKDT